MSIQLSSNVVIENAVAEMWKNLRYARVLVARDDAVEYFRVLTVVAHNLLKMLFALNGVFGWQESPKRYGWQVERFSIKPDEFYGRLCKTFTPPLDTSLRQITDVAREAVDLATNHVADLEQMLSRHLTAEPPRWVRE